MPAPVAAFSLAGLGVAVAAGATLTGLLLFAPPPPPDTIWFDTPIDAMVLQPGEHPIVLHVTDAHTSIRVNVVRDGILVDSLVDADLDVLPSPPDRVAWRAEFAYDFAEGAYVLEPLLDGRETPARPGIRVLVGDAELPPVPSGPAVTPSPTPSATATPTPTPTAEPTEEPPPAPLPTAPPPPPPAPTPSATVAPPPPVVFTGSVTRSPVGYDDWQSRYRATGISPSGAVARVQARVLSYDGGSVVQDWRNYDCVPDSGTAAPWSCTVPSAWVSPPRGYLYRIEYRLQLTSAGQVWYSPAASYATSDPHIG